MNMNKPMITNLGATARRSALLLTAVFLPCLLARANIVGPYTPDANTLYLFHFDEPAGSSVTANVGIKGGNCITVTNVTTTASSLATPPIVTTILGFTSYSTVNPTNPVNFGNCVSPTNTTAPYNDGLIGYDGNGNGVYNADINSGGVCADAIAITNLNFGNTNGIAGWNSPWTMEALVCPTNIATSGITQEIICTDDSNGNRGFQFRINASGQLEFNYIPAPANKDIFATIPTSPSDPNHFVANTWFHVALTYDGAYIRFYWTKLDPSSGSCNQIGADNAWACTNLQATIAPLVIGNENRAGANECFRGLIDEVRISNIARSPSQMMFTNPGVVIVKNPLSQSVDYFQPVNFSVTASSPTPMGYRWRLNGTPIPSDTATNTSYSVASVNLGNAGGYDCVVTNTTGYSATSHVAQLIVGADHFLAHRWSFNTNGNTSDSVGGATGTLVGSAIVTNGSLVLNGTSGTYMALPSLMLYNSNYTAATFEFWVNYGASSANDRVFDFGNTNWVGGVGILPPENYLYFAPNAGGTHVLGIAGGNQQSQESLSGDGNLDGQNMHVSCVVDPPDHLLAIYTNGILEVSYTNESTGFENIKDQNAWIGRSQFTADSYIVASIDELRIYSGALSPASIWQSDVQGPNVPLNAGAVAITVQPTNTTGAVGYPVSLIAALVGLAPISCQWYTNGIAIAGATNSIYTLTPSSTSQSGLIFQLLATNNVGGTNYNVASSNATLTVTVPETLGWAGVNGGNWDTSTLNWSNSAPALVNFAQYDGVVFNDRGGFYQTNVNLSLPVTLTSMVVSNNTYNYVFQSAGQVGSLNGQAVSLVKAGTGSLTLDVNNNCAGSTVIQNGILQVGNADGVGALGAGPVTNNATLVFNRNDGVTVTNNISGSGTVIYSGTNNLSLSGSNSYAGQTIISSTGTLHPKNANALGAATAGLINTNGGKLYVDVNVDYPTQPIQLGGGTALQKGGGGVSTLGGPVTLASDTAFSVDGGATLNLTNSTGVAATLSANLTLTGSGAGNITGPLSLGSGNVTVNGGTWTVAPSNNFSGLTTLNGGVLRITGALSFGPVPASPTASQVTLNRGTLEAATNITLNDGNIGINVADNSGITKDANTTLTISNPISGSSSVNLTNAGPGKLVLSGANSFSGTLFMDTFSQSANDGMVVIANPNAISSMPAFQGLPFIIFRSQNGGSSTLALDGTSGSINVAPDISLSGRATPSIENLAGDNTISGYFTLSSGGAYILQSDSGSLTLTQTWPYQPPADVTSARNLTLVGAGIITMAGGIQDGSLLGTNVPVNVLMSGPGILNLPVANTYSGTTTISNGTVVVSGSLSTGAVSVMGSGILAGNGVINGPVTDYGGNGVYPTDFTGSSRAQTTLTINNTFTMQGTVTMCISKTGGTRKSDLITGVTTANYGGTLVITNVTSDANLLTTNDTFTLFSATTHNGNFANIVGSPGPGLKYTFTNGVLGVAVGIKPVPHITSVSLSGTTLTISGTNGADSGQYVLLGSTDVALPLSQWTPLLTNYFDVYGNINLSTNIVNLALPQEFYILSQ